MDIYDHQGRFLENRYTRWYYAIITQAKDRITSQYTESHHVLPRSMFPNLHSNSTNRVNLTAKEHFICHWLLTKMVHLPDDVKKMWHAFWAMSMDRDRKRHRIPVRLWVKLREQRGIITAEQNRMRIWTEESKEKIRQFNKSRKQTEESNAKRSAKLKGRIISDETKEKMSLARINQTFSEETRNKMSRAKLGKKRQPHSEETKAKMRAAWAKKRGESAAHTLPQV